MVWNVAVVAEVGEVKGTAVLVWRKLAIVYISIQIHCQLTDRIAFFTGYENGVIYIQ